ncbi:hypothetical protein [Dictyobacter formicarum]|uniref:Uncharacterized protein n=1 Tax=Dictyobacter formicarum TaxID=2778368 RepID=A0ABQ3VN46_9CHLR|nr:hypothetical protein [Dictyobacter formicarum]GHO86521.1 hypothetical protein KSZ_45270 [Dictyobacter formicarum]
MSATLCPTTEIDLDICDLPVVTNDEYETAPMAVALPPQQPIDEETLYVGFEKAISDRCHTWKHLSDGTLNSVQHTSDSRHTGKNCASSVFPATNPLINNQVIDFLHYNWQRSVLVVCLALMFILIGFDVMGLLVLSMR